MPAISMRMSASSSTMRISAAMGSRQSCLRCLGLGTISRARVPERHAHDRAAARTVVELQQRAVILDDVLDDCQPKAGAARARGHIGFGQPLPPLIGQAAAIVLDAENDVVIAF